MARPLVSLCMIARDEAATIGRCLESARPYVDEMIVVDTGSDDETPAIAARLGAEVIHGLWREDFAEARNTALEQAWGRFVLVLDADEWIAGGPSAEELRETLRQAEDEAFTVTLDDRLDAGQRRRYPLVRLFRNRAGHRYEGAFHEQITPSIARNLGERHLRPADCGLVVGHDGYARASRDTKNKAERNLRMLLRRVEAEPSDVNARYFLVRELVPMRGGRAVPGSHLERALAHCEWLAPWKGRLAPPLAADFTRLHTAALLASGRPDDALRLLVGRSDGNPALELLRADAELALGGEDEQGARQALMRVERCFDLEDPGELPCVEPELGGPVARAHAAEALLALGRLEQAREMALTATRTEGAGAAPWNALALIERAMGDPAAALRSYLEGVRVDPYDPWAWAGIGEIVLQTGPPGEAVEPLANAAALAPGWSVAEEALTAALLLSGRSAEVVDRLPAGDDVPSPSTEAARLLAAAVADRPAPVDEAPAPARESMRRILRRVAAAGRADLLQRIGLG